MLTRKRIQKVVNDVLMNEGHRIVGVLLEHARKHDSATGPGNLAAMMEIFADRLAAEESDLVAVIDKRMGSGWTRKLAESLSGNHDAD